jgi:hypothetical protein
MLWKGNLKFKPPWWFLLWVLSRHWLHWLQQRCLVSEFVAAAPLLVWQYPRRESSIVMAVLVSILCGALYPWTYFFSHTRASTGQASYWAFILIWRLGKTRLNRPIVANRLSQYLAGREIFYGVGAVKIFGAGDEIRTRDINLGKVALYQLSYSRKATSLT